MAESSPTNSLQYIEQVYNEIASLAQDENYHNRQEFIRICNYMYLKDKGNATTDPGSIKEVAFRSIILSKILTLNNDPVLDVRLEFQRSLFNNE